MYIKIRANWILVVALTIVMATPALAAPSHSPWSPALRLDSIPGSGPAVNTEFLDGCPILSRDGHQLYLASNRPNGLGGLDIWIATRTTPDGPFADPVNIGAPINSESNDFCPSPLQDGHGFVFVSNRPGGCGGADIYMTRYDPVNGWHAPVNLGCDVNSTADEAGPVLSFAEPGPPTLYFSSTRSDGPGGADIYMSQMTDAWSFGSAKLVPGVNSDYEDMQPSLSQDGREMVFSSNRPGSQGFDIWSASRGSIVGSWGEPINLGPSINSVANESRPSLSWDAKILLFGSTRIPERSSDIYYSTRD